MHRKIIGNRVDCLHVYYIFGRDAISAKSLVQQLAVVIKDVPKLFTINVGDKEEAYFSSLIASSKYKLSLYMNVKTLPTIIYPFILCILVRGAVASWLVCSTPDRVVQVRALAGDIVLCS